jgi:Holliday junction resolvasome RuvABC endonuclease subunit
VYIGVDPGTSGAIAAVGTDGMPIGHIKNKATDRELWVWLQPYSRGNAIIEKVHSMPGQGVASSFKFGASYGAMKMLLACAGLSYEEVTPAKWQGALRCRTKGDKNVTKRKAQELFPQVKMTHAIADAYLLAEYCRRMRLGLPF